MILSWKDKLLHMAACFLITVGTFLLLLAARRFYVRSYQISGEDEAPASRYDIEAASDDVDANITGTKQYNFNRYIEKDWFLAVVASSVALLIGITKEIGDMYNFWWLCQAKNQDGSILGCDASLADFLADVVGIILANCILFASRCAWISFADRRTRLSTDYTMARSNS